MNRVLFIMGNMGMGGAETHIMKVYRAIVPFDIQFDFVINVPQKCYYEDEILSLGGKIYRIEPKSKGIIAYTKNLKKIVKENSYNVVFKCGENAMSWTDMYAAKKGGATIRIMRSTNSSVNSLKGRIVHHLSRCLLRHYVTNKVAPSKLAGEWMFGKHHCKDLILINNGVDLEYYKFTLDKRNKIRDQYHITDQLLFGHVGRFAPQKNHDFLIDVFLEYHKINPKSMLMLVGEGSLQDDIRKKVDAYGLTDQIIFAGAQSSLSEYYSAMDAFLFPSLYEGMPNTVIEAQACGLKCIIADTITQDANITGNVQYMPLAKEHWVEYLKNVSIESFKHVDAGSSFIEKKYDIQSVVKTYIGLFGL